MKVENFVSGFQEVDLFTTSISSANEGRMKITFKEEAEMTGFPEMLKNELVRYCNSIGNADSQISESEGVFPIAWETVTAVKG